MNRDNGKNYYDSKGRKSREIVVVGEGGKGESWCECDIRWTQGGGWTSGGGGKGERVGLPGVICEVEGEGRSIGPGESHG
ncbi:hypothetical protein Pmani_037560 [Petrolisthes manimaculis]|uniref:Uncharacterized protein n=1 Tax=Petrolisthes manimaculis TaxID=1843537 RepID=A0AAE1NHI3_9EUCA|nr:hypothetical protein Pmani_037560 [Petrolisthes manimaculis]